MLDKSGIYDELELGDRAADEQLMEEFGALYSPEKSRVWSVVLLCYRRVHDKIDPVPREWCPDIREDGMWYGYGET